MRLYALVLCLLLSLAAPASAEEKKDQPPPATANPHMEKVVAMAKELAVEVDDDQAHALAEIRNGFGMIRAVGIVRDDVSNAVGLCGKANPDMKEAMAGRFKNMAGALDPVLKQKDAEIETAIKDVGFRSPDKVRTYLRLIDESAHYADSKIDKTVVTTKEACQGLLESMDRTQPEIIRLLEGIVWPQKKEIEKNEDEKADKDEKAADGEVKE